MPVAPSGIDAHDSHRKFITGTLRLATDRTDNNNILPATEQRAGSFETQAFNLVVYAQVFCYILVKRRQVSFRLIEVVVADKILNGIIGEKLLELAVELCSKGLVMAHHQHRLVDMGNDV